LASEFSSGLDWRAALDAPPDGKRCSRCCEWLPAAAFRPNPRMSSGLHSWCRACAREGMREWRAEHREQLNAKRRAGPFPTTCADCAETFAARVRTQVCCPDCQASMRRARKR
jgi:hypothetical protein